MQTENLSLNTLVCPRWPQNLGTASPCIFHTTKQTSNSLTRDRCEDWAWSELVIMLTAQYSPPGSEFEEHCIRLNLKSILAAPIKGDDQIDKN